MRAIIQRVSSASVTVDNETVSQISRGLMVLIGIGTDDTMVDATTIINKILSLRVFNDESDGKMWKKSVRDIDGDVLCVSQFTLLANTTKENKPDFHRAMATEPSRALYASLLDRLRNSYKPEKVKGMLDPKLRIAALEEYLPDGVFGAMMSVSLTNEGPVTLTIDSRKFEYVDNALPAKIDKKGGSSPSPAAQPSGL